MPLVQKKKHLKFTQNSTALFSSRSEADKAKFPTSLYPVLSHSFLAVSSRRKLLPRNRSREIMTSLHIRVLTKTLKWVKRAIRQLCGFSVQ